MAISRVTHGREIHFSCESCIQADIQIASTLALMNRGISERQSERILIKNIYFPEDHLLGPETDRCLSRRSTVITI